MIPRPPLVAVANPDISADPWAGVWIAEDIETILAGVKSGSWVDVTLGAVSAGLDALAFVSDPIGSLLQYGVAWIIEHVKPLSEALDWLAGDPTTNPEERLVSDIVGPIAYYALAPSGIYYTGQNNLGGYVGLHFFDRARNRTVEVASRAVTGEMGGLTVSPDGRRLLYVQTSPPQTDLTLIRFE